MKKVLKMAGQREKIAAIAGEMGFHDTEQIYEALKTLQLPA